MTEIATTAANIGVVFPDAAEIYSGVASEDIVAGQAVLQDADGLLALAAATGAVWGVALESGGAGQGIAVLIKGHMEGAAVSAIAPHAAIYTGAAGTLDDAGTVVLGQVLALSDSAATKVAYIG